MNFARSFFSVSPGIILKKLNFIIKYENITSFGINILFGAKPQPKSFKAMEKRILFDSKVLLFLQKGSVCLKNILFFLLILNSSRFFDAKFNGSSCHWI